MELEKNIKLISPIRKYPFIGWREWVGLPALGIVKIKAKIDTGARTSALHAFSLKPFVEDGQHKISFDIHPLQHNTDQIITCVANIVDKRLVTDSGGHEEERYVIQTPITIAGQTWPIEITLTERETMLFRMLLGRSALRKRFIVNPARSFVTTRIHKK
ncbi:MAG: ATP-dependent zinc protease [Gammaproteobacteria bacterium]|nr:MAG: ATP-dependent zinc protease [Gammaproteobacteria bacterium]